MQINKYQSTSQLYLECKFFAGNVDKVGKCTFYCVFFKEMLKGFIFFCSMWIIPLSKISMSYWFLLIWYVEKKYGSCSLSWVESVDCFLCLLFPVGLFCCYDECESLSWYTHKHYPNNIQTAMSENTRESVDSYILEIVFWTLDHSSPKSWMSAYWKGKCNHIHCVSELRLLVTMLTLGLLKLSEGLLSSQIGCQCSHH